MKLTKKQLDTPISDLFESADNTETMREFIRNSEKEFGLPFVDLDNMNDEEINKHIELLDYLWEK